MPFVRLLDAQTANQIAAGEVVERPAAAAKELVENALDAGATRITLEVEEGGRVLLRVTDNGCGMTAPDAELALQRHATSKITSADDLTRLRTLGFRGEALPSIASISHFEVITRTTDADAATRLYLEGGALLDRSEVGAPPGTRITVRHLFHNTPARLKFMKSVSTEANHLFEIVGRLAMAHPEVAVRLTHNSREVFSTPGTGEGRDALAALWGRDRAAALLPAASATPYAAVTGFVSPPEQSRPNRGQQAFFVNRRPIVSRLLAHALDNAFRPLIPQGRFAAAALFLDLSPEEIDVNVSPSKTEVRFRHEREVHSAVSQAVRAALMSVPAMSRPVEEEDAPLPAALLRPPGASRFEGGSPDRYMPESLLRRTDPSPASWHGVEAEGYSPAEASAPSNRTAAAPDEAPTSPDDAPTSPDDASLPPPRAPAMADDPFDAAIEAEGASQEEIASADSTSGEAHDLNSTGEMSFPAQPVAEMLGGMRLLGQVMNTFLVGEGRDGIILIDQHVAHERILYDRLLRARDGRQAMNVQRLLLPLTVTLSPREAATLDARLPELRRLGFEVEPFGGETFILRAYPAELGHRNPERILRDLAADLTEEWGAGKSVMERAVDAVIASASCHGAIKANMPLGPVEMRRLIEDLIHSDDPFRCPHGRPILVRITGAELMKWFKRTG